MADFAILRQSSFLDLRITARNQSAVISNFRRLDEDGKRRVRALVEEWGYRLRDEAVDRAPYAKVPEPPHHPGFLKANTEVRFSRGMLSFEVGSWQEPFTAIGENLYAIFQEYGTSQHEAQPYLNPTFEWGVPLYLEDMGDLLRGLARDYGDAGSG